jgi:type II secretion system protein G
MKYKCPYCQHLIEGEPIPRCPSCSKVMVVPKMRETNERFARRRKIDAIWRENEQKKSELQGVLSPSMFRDPKFYLAIMFIMGLIGYALFNATDTAVERQKASPELRTLRNLDVLAEALGRYRFHVGRYPTVRQGGLGALVRAPGPIIDPKWNGPYINLLGKDAWGMPYVYEFPREEGALPTLFSCGPDRLPNTMDDLKPDPQKFDPGTEWTNGWVSAEERMPGVKILKSDDID